MVEINLYDLICFNNNIECKSILNKLWSYLNSYVSRYMNYVILFLWSKSCCEL